jgi:hypothetical protein
MMRLLRKLLGIKSPTAELLKPWDVQPLIDELDNPELWSLNHAALAAVSAKADYAKTADETTNAPGNALQPLNEAMTPNTGPSG